MQTIYQIIEPYDKVLGKQKIKSEQQYRLIEADIDVRIHLNIDMYNASDLRQLVEELHAEFDGTKKPCVYLHTLLGEVAKQVAITDDERRKVLFEEIRGIKECLKKYALPPNLG